MPLKHTHKHLPLFPPRSNSLGIRRKMAFPDAIFLRLSILIIIMEYIVV